MDYRVRGIPGAILRRVRAKAGDRLNEVFLGLLEAYADGKIDPLSSTERKQDRPDVPQGWLKADPPD